MHPSWPPRDRQLSQALEGYRGAILVASHDVPFPRSAGITRWLGLDRDTGLTVVEPLWRLRVGGASPVR